MIIVVTCIFELTEEEKQIKLFEMKISFSTQDTMNGQSLFDY